MQAFLSRFKSFYAKPFNPDGSAMAWFLFIGLLLLIMIGWRMILGAINLHD